MFQGRHVNKAIRRADSNRPAKARPTRLAVITAKPGGPFVVYVRDHGMYLGSGTFTPTKFSATRFDFRFQAQEAAGKLQSHGVFCTVRGFNDCGN